MVDDRALAPTGPLSRFAARLRRGMLLQEVVERLGRSGLLLFPYFLTSRELVGATVPQGLASPPSFRELSPADAPLLAAVEGRPMPVRRAAQRLADARYFGIFLDGALVAYNSASRDVARQPLLDGPVYRLASDEAFLWDTYVVPRCRGLRLVQHLGEGMSSVLRGEGVRRVSGAQGAFNTASRRFSTRLGAHRVELRLLLGVPRFWAVDLRLWSRAAPLGARWIRLARAAGTETS